MQRHPQRTVVVLSLALLCALPATACAHRDDYLDETFVYMTLDRREVEPEYWIDFGDHAHSADAFVRHNFTIEYGLTQRWTIDGRATVLDDRGEPLRFASGRCESRYRFAEEGALPVDVAMSAEIASNRTQRGSYESDIEPRLILSKDLDEMNLTLNLVEEIPMEGGRAAFVPSAGIRYGTAGRLRLGSELTFNTDTLQGAVIPQIWFAFPHEVTLKFGFSHGFDRSTEDFGRVAIEIGL